MQSKSARITSQGIISAIELDRPLHIFCQYALHQVNLLFRVIDYVLHLKWQNRKRVIRERYSKTI